MSPRLYDCVFIGKYVECEPTCGKNRWEHCAVVKPFGKRQLEILLTEGTGADDKDIFRVGTTLKAILNPVDQQGGLSRALPPPYQSGMGDAAEL
jgi:hypothetical protein